ncbi:acyl-CoA synthetase [Ferrimonas pelagia]|uniref:Acyl-CoA synthetase n=1 Tax=Ferrimonas pelagia TaxID=1177826 RepID=A0ABP9EEC9_9GAMM
MSLHPCTYASSTPDKPAIIMAGSGEQLTFAQLEDVSNRGAQLLRSLGLENGDHIAVMAENSLEYLAVSWAALRSGLYFTPVPIGLTAEEAAYMIDDCDAKAFVVSAKVAAKLSIDGLKLSCPGFSVGGDVAGLRRFETERDAMPAQRIDDECEGLNMMYSSGTTGKPKGISRPFMPGPLGEGNSAAGFPGMQQQMFRASSAATYLAPAPLYHAAPLYWLQAYTRLGATVVVMESFEAEAALAAIDQYQITHSQWVPTMFIKMLKLDDTVRSKYRLDSLQVAVHAAAPCPIPVKQQMIDWWGPKIFEYYTGSEGNGMTFITPQEWLANPGSVGRPIVGELHIVDDESGQELPADQAGTIYFASPYPFAYHKAPEKTASVTLKNGWSTLGDVGYVNEQGYLFLTDRKSNMIISGGVNIYPQETENALIMHPAVADVAVIGVPDEEFGESVKAVVQLQPDWEGDADLAVELIAFCKDQIAKLKCPKSVDFVAELPRSDTGKLIKRKLKARYWS